MRCVDQRFSNATFFKVETDTFEKPVRYLQSYAANNWKHQNEDMIVAMVIAI